MSVTITKANYPEMTASAAISGKRQVIYINYGIKNSTPATADAPVWSLLGGLRSHSVSLSASINTVNMKELGLWAGGGLVSKAAELSADIVMLRNDEAQNVIENFMYNDEISSEKHGLQVAIVDLDTKDYTKMWIIPTSWELTADSEDLISRSLTATVIGAPVQGTNFAAQ